MTKQIQRLRGIKGFVCSEKGEVYNLNIHHLNSEIKKPLKVCGQKGKAPFVRLSYKGKNISLTIGKAILLAYKPFGYEPGKIAVFKDGNNNNIQLSNLKWGTRKEQSAIAMSNPINYERVKRMGQKHGVRNGKNNVSKLVDWNIKNKYYSEEEKQNVLSLIADGKKPVEISELLSIPRGSIHGIVRRSKK